MSTPAASRPQLPATYGVPANSDGSLAWNVIREHLARAQEYWLATTCPDGRPHLVPIWGLWLDDCFYFGGAPATRWARNLALNKCAAIHTGDGRQATIVEGDVEACVPAGELAARLRADSAAKYGAPADPEAGPNEPVLCLRPRTALAWTDFPHDATRWRWTSDQR